MEVPDPESYVANPLNGFGMMERMGKSLNQMKFAATVTARAEEAAEISKRLTEAKETFPTFGDYEDTAHGLVRFCICHYDGLMGPCTGLYLNCFSTISGSASRRVRIEPIGDGRWSHQHKKGPGIPCES